MGCNIFSAIPSSLPSARLLYVKYKVYFLDLSQCLHPLDRVQNWFDGLLFCLIDCFFGGNGQACIYCIDLFSYNHALITPKCMKFNCPSFRWELPYPTLGISNLGNYGWAACPMQPTERNKMDDKSVDYKAWKENHNCLQLQFWRPGMKASFCAEMYLTGCKPAG